MKKLLYVDCNFRKEASRTKALAETFLAGIDRTRYEIETVDLTQTELLPLDGSRMALRDRLLSEKNTAHEIFLHANRFAGADVIVIAAPFWDLSFPAKLKIYIENVSVGGITFAYGERGMFGLCRATDLVFLTTRGGIYTDSPLECGSAYIKALTELFGIGRYHCVSADGLDMDGLDADALLAAAKSEAADLAGKL